MKVVRTVPAFYPHVTGPANQAYQISRRLQEREIKSPVWTSQRGAEDELLFDSVDNVVVRRYPIVTKFMSFKLMPLVPLDLYYENFDIIHSHCYRGLLTEAAYRGCKRKDKPFVIHNHGTFLGYEDIASSYKKIPYKLYDKATKKGAAVDADAVIVSTSEEKEQAIEFGVSPGKVHLIPAGIEVSEYSGVDQHPNESFTALFVGRLSRNRNVEQAIKAISQLSDDIQLRIVGDEAKSSHAAASGYVAELKKLTRDEGVQDRVTFTGAKYGDDLKKEYASADVFIYTSVYENLGQTILEATAAGLPVVTTPVGVANELVVNGETGYLVPIGDHDAVAERIRDVREIGHKKMGSQMQDKIENRYDWEVIIGQYIELYENII
ncbi:glycosyltransferase family 4 protein [Haloferacaceae archaeon DSL9]